MVWALLPLKKTSPPTRVLTPLIVAVSLLPNLSQPPRVSMLLSNRLMPSPSRSASAHSCVFSGPPSPVRWAPAASDTLRADFSSRRLVPVAMLVMGALTSRSAWVPELTSVMSPAAVSAALTLTAPP